MKLSTTLLAACAIGAASAFHASPAAVRKSPTAAAAALKMSTVEADASASSPSPGGEANVARGERQKLYGESLEMPKTYVRCGRCGAAYALQPDDLGTRGKGRRVECSVCSHSWFQARDRLFDLKEGYELEDFPQTDLDRIAKNIAAGRSPDFVGVAKFYVGNLAYSVTEDDLREAFGAVGECGDASIVTDNETGRSRGFAFVTMFTKEDGEKALALDGTELGGRTISVRPPNN